MALSIGNHSLRYNDLICYGLVLSDWYYLILPFHFIISVFLIIYFVCLLQRLHPIQSADPISGQKADLVLSRNFCPLLSKIGQT